MIECLKLQLKAQLEGLEKLKQFTIQQIGLSMDYARLTEEVHQTLAKVTLTWEWVQKEMTIFLDEGSQSKLYPFVELLEGKRREVRIKNFFLPWIINFSKLGVLVSGSIVNR